MRPLSAAARPWFWGSLFSLWNSPALSLAPPQPGSSSLGITYELPVDQKPEENPFSTYFPNIQDLFGSISSDNVKSGARLINHSLDSLFDSLFYSLLDNSFTYSYSDSYQLNLNLNRSVFSTDFGSYVIMDRFSFGPEYDATLTTIESVPVILGNNAGIDIVDIHLQSEARRLVDKELLPTWRYAFNNWFGIVPALRALLPPSFNPLQLYDPLRQVETPLVFPLSYSAFAAMPIGTIRSYGISGGVNLPFTLANYVLKNLPSFVERSLLDVATPYSLFLQGEHRINVLRKSKNIAWVGLSTSKTAGHGLAGMVGSTFFLLQDSLKPLPFKGLKTPFFPFDMGIADSLISSTQHLYEFDLSDERGLKAYLAAVHGDFSQAIAQCQAREKARYLTFHFEQRSQGRQIESHRLNNFFLYRAQHQENSKRNKITMFEPSGKYYIWEAGRQQGSSSFDVLLGESEIQYNNQVEIRVQPENEVSESDEAPDLTFKFVGSKPYQLICTMQIRDQLADVFEYEAYLAKLRRVSKFPLDEFPQLPQRSEERKIRALERSYASRPDSLAYVSDDSITRVGTFHATYSANLPYKLLRQAINAPHELQAQYFAEAYKLSASEHPYEDLYATSAILSHFLGRWFSYPLRLFNIQSDRQDAFGEVRHIIDSFAALRIASTPLEIQNGFYQLLRLEYPEAFLVGMMRFLPDEEIPRNLSFFIKPEGELGPGFKTQFERINVKKFQSSLQTSDFDRYHIAQEKLNAFFPTNMHALPRRPQIISVYIQALREPNTPSDALPKFVVEVSAKGLSSGAKGKIYLRFENKGQVQLNKFVLLEEIRESPAQKSLLKPTQNLDYLSYQFILEKPDDSFNSLIYEQQFQLSQEFQLILAISSDGIVWSNEKIFAFSYDEGKLKEIQED